MVWSDWSNFLCRLRDDVYLTWTNDQITLSTCWGMLRSSLEYRFLYIPRASIAGNGRTIPSISHVSICYHADSIVTPRMSELDDLRPLLPSLLLIPPRCFSWPHLAVEPVSYSSSPECSSAHHGLLAHITTVWSWFLWPTKRWGELIHKGELRCIYLTLL